MRKRAPPFAAVVPFLALLLAGCGGGGRSGSDAAEVTLGPVLAHVTPTTARIAWRTADAQPGRLEVSLDGGAPTVRDLPAAREQDVTLTGLPPGATVRYRAFAGATELGGEHAFVLPSGAAGAVLRFDVAGDTGTGLPPALQLFANVEADAPDLFWICGDCAYTAGTANQVLAGFTRPLAALRTTTPVYSVLGNHDVITGGGQPLLDAVFLPVNDRTGTEHYYAFTRGDCLLVGLDSNRSLADTSEQHAWLASVLASAPATWRFVFLHHTTYSSSNHGSSTTLQASLAPLMESAGVDVVFCGHDHDYERTFPLAGGTPVGAAADPDFVDPGGPVWVVTGGGTNLYGSGTSAFTAHSESVNHHVRVRVEGLRLDLDATDLDGTVIDRMSITKTP